MAKKAALKLVTTDAEPAKPPLDLGRPGRTLWDAITSEFEINDSAGRELLSQACIAADRAEECAAEISRDGVTVDTRCGPKEHPLLKHELANRSFRDGVTVDTRCGPKEHPLLKHELANRSFVIRALGKLGLTFEAIKPIGRPPLGR
jgi:hypothetical protein